MIPTYLIVLVLFAGLFAAPGVVFVLSRAIAHDAKKAHERQAKLALLEADSWALLVAAGVDIPKPEPSKFCRASELACAEVC